MHISSLADGGEIAEALYQWGATEQSRSEANRNAYLSDYTVAMEERKLGYDDPSHKSAQKNHAHLGRLVVWTQGFEAAHLRNDIAARQLFSVQMFLAGVRRLRSYLVSEDESEYLALRVHDPSMQADFLTAVTRRVSSWRQGLVPTVSEDSISMQDIVGQTTRTAEMYADYWSTLFNRQMHAPEFGRKQSESLEITAIAEEMWLDVATDLVLFVAQERGKKFEKVPFYEPVSISDDPGIYYPFAGEPIPARPE